jgi:large conductance mechanosensitive channel
VLKDFRDYLMRGNIIDLAVAFVIGAAFALVVTSFTADILTPLLGLIGLPDLSQWVLTTPGGAEIRYGSFLNTLIAFVLTAAAIYFFVIKPMERIRRPEETKTCPECSSEIPIAARRCPLCTSQLPA